MIGQQQGGDLLVQLLDSHPELFGLVQRLSDGVARTAPRDLTIGSHVGRVGDR